MQIGGGSKVRFEVLVFGSSIKYIPLEFRNPFACICLVSKNSISKLKALLGGNAAEAVTFLVWHSALTVL